MDDRSWWELEPDPPSLALPDDLRARDPLQGRDCGWVSQMRPFVRHFCAPGSVVLDPFCGFGSTLLAAHVEGRKAIGVEVDPGRAALARARLQRQGCAAPVLVGAMPDIAPPRGIALCLTNVPYFGCGWGGADAAGQLYAAPTYAQYLDGLRDVFHAVRGHLAEDAHCIAMAQNVVVGGRAIPQVHDIAGMLGGLFEACEERALCYRRPVHALAAGDSRSNRSHETALVFRHRRGVLDLQAASELLAALDAAGFAYRIWGSYVEWVRDPGAVARPPADLDLQLPRQQAALDRLLAWLQARGFALSLWGREAVVPVALEAVGRFGYVRAVRVDAAGGRLQLDLSLLPT